MSRLERFLVRASSTCGLVVLLAGPSAAGSGLDPTFGQGGKIETGFGHNAIPQNAVTQSDGRVVVVGTIDDFNIATRPFHIARYLANGSLDKGFGTGGSALVAFTNFLNTAASVAFQPDGKIVVAGGTQSADGSLNQFALARLTASGALDTRFGNDGKVTTDFFGPPPHVGGFREAADVVLLQPDGKILLGGLARTSPKRVMKTALARYTPTGALDPTFGVGGLVTDSLIGNVNALAIRSDGHILALNSSGGVEEFTANGARVTAVSIGPVLATNHTGNSLFQPDGKVIVAQAVGGGAYRTNVDMRLARMAPNGAIDPGFASPTFDFADGDNFADAAQALALTSAGQIAVGGIATPASGSSVFGLARVNADGSLDGGFGTGGRLTTSFAGSDQVVSLVFLSDGRMLAVGQTYNSKTQLTDIALARYLASANSARTLSVPTGPSVTRLSIRNNPRRAGPITIELALASAGRVSVGVYDLVGRRVRSLAEGTFESGAHALTWDGTDERHQRVAGGVYFVRVESADGGAMTRKLVILD